MRRIRPPSSQRVLDVAFEFLEAAGGPDVPIALLGSQGETRAEGENLRRQPEQMLGALGHEPLHLHHVLSSVEDVRLVEHDDDLLAPVTSALEKGPFALGERPIDRRDEEDEIRSRHEVRGDALVLSVDRVRTGRVHDVDVPKHVDRRGENFQLLLDHLMPICLTVAKHGHPDSRRSDALTKDGLAEQRVDERALTRVELADDHEQEELVQLLDRPLERHLMLGRGVEPRQRDAEVPQTAALLLEQGLLTIV